ncbi:amidohydrolase family protein [Cystobacter fuscus]|uniref:amidohydrolase family protein n=1 Tax=Cystobacter fuscus TaxID=43 RepID=UPI002B2D158E|nr:amidohydrolase family protein [Cystobacter fuscus]
MAREVEQDITMPPLHSPRSMFSIAQCVLAISAFFLLTGAKGLDQGGTGATLAAPSFTGPPAAGRINRLLDPVSEFTLTLTEGTNMAAAPSPDATRIALALQGALYVVPFSGGEARRISTWSMEVTHPVWSPDGSRIAFQNYDTEGNYHIWTIAPDGSNATRVTSGPFDDREPSWSADGSRLVFSSDRGGDMQYKIWSIGVADGQYQQLTTGAGAESHPALSPDGTKLLLVENGGVILVDLVTGARTSRGAGSAPAWTPDGSDVISQGGGYWSVNGIPVNAASEDLFPFPARFLPDGRFLYTGDGKIRIRATTGESVSDVPFSAHVALRRPVFTPKAQHRLDDLDWRTVKGISAPILSPNGEKVAFVALNDIWVLSINGDGQPVRLTDTRDYKASPGWSPDGSFVYFSTDRESGGVLAVDKVELSSRKRSRLALLTGISMAYPSLSPSGRQLAYWTGGGRVEIHDLTARTSTVLVNPSLGTGVSRPSWSPDERLLAVCDAERVNNRFREGYNKLRIIDINNKTAVFHAVGPTPASISERNEAGPVWSPDGRKMAFIMDSLLYVMPVNPDGSPNGPAAQLTTYAADMPSWGPDSNTLLFMASGHLRTINLSSRATHDVALDMRYRQATPDGITIIHAGSLWDGLTATLQYNKDIIIDKNRIVAIEPHGTRAPDTANRYIDASGLTVMPGLWDSHVHPLDVFNNQAYGLAWAEMLAWGVTSTLSMGGDLYQSVEVREALDAGVLVGPRAFIAPPLYDGSRVFYPSARAVRNEQVAELEMSRMKPFDVDLLKAYVRAPIPVMEIVARTAHELGLPSFSHFLSPGIQTGLLGTSHLSATERLGYSWSVSTRYQDVRELRTRGLFNMVATTGSSQNDPVVRGGGLVTMGTDFPLAPAGSGLHTILREEATTLGAFEVLKTVTINGALNARVGNELGSIEPGKLADLIAIRGNPLENVANVGNIVYVVKNGLATTPEEIRARFTTTRALTQRAKALDAFAKACRKDPEWCHPSGMAGH